MSQLKEFGTGTDSVILDLDDVTGYSPVETIQPPGGGDNPPPPRYTMNVHLTGTVIDLTFADQTVIDDAYQTISSQFQTRVGDTACTAGGLTFDAGAVTTIGALEMQPAAPGQNGEGGQLYLFSCDIHLKGTAATLSWRSDKANGNAPRQKIIDKVNQTDLAAA